MRINRALLSWGLFFIVLGGVVLAVRQGLVPAEAVQRAWTLWPVLLILLGLELVLRRTPVEPLAGLAIAVTFGLIVGGVVAGGSFPVGDCGDEQGSRPFEARSGELSGSAEVHLELLCGELTVRTAGGSTWRLEGVDEDGEGPDVEASADSLDIRSQSRSVLDARDRWTVTLPSETELDLRAQVNAGAARLDLDGARIARASVQVNAGEATVDLSGASALGDLNVQLNAVGGSRILLPDVSFDGRIEANAAGTIRICAPAGAGLRLTVNDSFAASHNYGTRGLVRDGDTWQSPGYDAAATQIDLRTQVNAGSFELEAEGCQ